MTATPSSIFTHSWDLEYFRSVGYSIVIYLQI